MSPPHGFDAGTYKAVLDAIGQFAALVLGLAAIASTAVLSWRQSQSLPYPFGGGKPAASKPAEASAVSTPGLDALRAAGNVGTAFPFFSVPVFRATQKTDEDAEQLKEYFKANLAQLSQVFKYSITAMIVGLIVLLLSVTMQGSAQLAAIIGGALSQFIAATFLVVYRSALGQANAYAQILERMRLTNALALQRESEISKALELIDQIQDDKNDVKNRARADVAKLLVEGSAGPLTPRKSRTSNGAPKRADAGGSAARVSEND